MALYPDNSKLFDWAVSHGFDPTKVPASDPYNWVIAALHPASPNIGPVTGLPDMDTQPTMMFNWRQTDAIAPPTGLTTGETWDLEVVHLPGPGVFAVYRSKKSSAAWSTATYGWIVNNQYNWDGAGPTIATDGSFSSYGTPGSWVDEITQYRLAYAGFTGTLNAATMTDQGMMVGCQMQSPWFQSILSNVAKPPSAINGAPAQEMLWLSQFVNYTNPDNTAIAGFDQVFGISPMAEQWRARDGYYFPIRFKDGNFHWQSGQKMCNQIANPWTNSSWYGSSTQKPVPPIGNGSIALACFRGIASTTTLSVTSRVGYECCVNSTSNFRPFVTRSCPPDMLAIQEYFKLSSQLGDIYPSAFNDEDLLSSILTGISGFLPKPLQDKVSSFLPVAAKGIMALRNRKKNKKLPETEKVADEMVSDKSLEATVPATKKGPRPVRRALGAVTNIIPGGKAVKAATRGVKRVLGK